MRAIATLLMLGTLGATAAEPAAPTTPLPLPNPGFEQGLTGWIYAPGDAAQAGVVDAGAGRPHVLELRPDSRAMGVQTEPLAVGGFIRPDQAYRVAADLEFERLEGGVFAFSMYAYDGAGKALRQLVFHRLSPTARPYGWTTRAGDFGPGTANPLPDGTATVAVRFSFAAQGADANGHCRARLRVDNVSITPVTPSPFAAWPAEIVATVGDLQVRFESRSFWTLYRIDYQGVRLGKDAFGSHYGSVVRLPKVGFVGSGHTESGETEEVLDLQLEVDGTPVRQPAAAYTCRDIRLSKRSRVRSLEFQTVVRVADGQIDERVALKAAATTPVELIYHFMHPWVPTVSDYLAENPAGQRLAGTFTGDRSQRLDQAVSWSAVYDRSLQMGAVTRLAEVQPPQETRTRYWDVPDVYRKHYLVTFLGATVPAAQEFRYRALTRPFAAPPASWQAKAVATAAALQP